MKRPFAVIGLTYLSGLVASMCFGAETSWVMAAAFAAAFAAVLFIKPLRRDKTVPVVFITLAAALAVYSAASAVLTAPVQTLDGKTVKITGSIADIPYENYGRFYYKIETKSVDDAQAPQNIKFMLSSPSPVDADYYDDITAEVTFYKPSGQMDSYYASKGMYVTGVIQDQKIEVTKTKDKPLYYYAMCARKAVSDQITRRMPSEEASFAGALLLGDKYRLDQSIKQDFNTAGVGHIIVVSGLHMSVIQGFLYFILLKITKRKKLAAGISILGIFIFMAITAFAPSVVRSGIMLIVFMLAQMFDRTSDSLNSIGIAAIALTILNPLSAGDTGMLMSFAATLGIILFFPAADKFVYHKFARLKYGKRALHFITSTFLVSLCATVTTFPIMLFTFGTFSPYFLLSNLLLVWAAQALLICCLPMVIFSFMGLFAFLAYPFALAASLIAAYMIRTAAWVAGLPFSSVGVDQPFILLWLGAALLLTAVGILMNRGFRPVKYIVPLSLAILLCGSVTFAAFRSNAVELKILYTGDGISAVLEKGTSKALLACGGGVREDALLRSLEAYGKETDFMLIASGSRLKRYAQDITNEFDVKNILLYDTNSNKTLKEDLSEYIERLYTFDQNKTVELWGDVSLDTLAVSGNVWTYVKTKGGSVLICPDGGSFKDIPPSWRTADICVVSLLPEDYYLVKAGVTVISNTQEKAAALAQEIAPFQEKIAAVAEDLDITLQLCR